MDDRLETKVCGAAELRRRRDDARARGLTVAHCHGCFDIVHPGHIRHLRFARVQADVLLVSVSGDAQINKGASRPLIPQELRAENLAALDCVDWVFVDDRPTAAELLDEVRPDVYVKGREYETNDDPRFKRERETVERHGGRVVFSSGDVVFSSTALIDAIASDGHAGSEDGAHATGGMVDPRHRALRELASRPDLSPQNLSDVMSAWRGARVLVVGEVIRDSYVFCERPEVSGESPMMTLRPVEHRVYDGGAAVIARHAAAMGASPTLVTALPETREGEELRMSLMSRGVEVRSVPTPAAIPEKQRFLVGQTKVMKVDLVERVGVDAASRDTLVRLAASLAAHEDFDAAIVADFGLGLLSPASIRSVCGALRPRVPVLTGGVSGRRASLTHMRSLDLVTPTEDELREAMRDFGDALPAVTWRMLRDTGIGSAVVTMGPEGLIAFEPIEEDHGGHDAGDDGFDAGGGATDEGSGRWRTRLTGRHVPSLTPHAVDPLGAGDSLLTAATLALSTNATLTQAAYLGAAAAALQCRSLGNIPIQAAALRREITRVARAELMVSGMGGEPSGAAPVPELHIARPTGDPAAGLGISRTAI